MCWCSFELRSAKFLPKESLECPNCGQKLPARVYESLKDGVMKFASVPRSMPTVPAFDLDKGKPEEPIGGEFVIEVKEFEEPAR